MKYKIYVLLVFFFVGFTQAQKIKTNSFKNDEIKVQYPKTWFKFGAIGHVYFIPKIIRKNTFENEVEHVSVNKNIIRLTKQDSIENVLKSYANVLTKNQIKKDFKIIQSESSSKFIYKIESLINYKSKHKTFKRIEYFFINEEDNLESYRYQMRDDLFDKYYEEAMLIINSIQKR